jgi:hypothetical protein
VAVPNAPFFTVYISSLTGLEEAYRPFSTAINILSLTGHLPCMIHKSPQKSSFAFVQQRIFDSRFQKAVFQEKPEVGAHHPGSSE